MQHLFRPRLFTLTISLFLAGFFSLGQAADGSRVVRQTETAAARAAASASQSNNTVSDEPTTAGDPLLVIEELSADLYSDNTVLLIQGKVTNKSHKPMRGYVLVKILDKDDNVITAVETEINESRKFYHGQTRSFEEAVDVSAIKGMANVAIEFVELTNK